MGDKCGDKWSCCFGHSLAISVFFFGVCDFSPRLGATKRFLDHTIFIYRYLYTYIISKNLPPKKSEDKPQFFPYLSITNFSLFGKNPRAQPNYLLEISTWIVRAKTVGNVIEKLLVSRGAAVLYTSLIMQLCDIFIRPLHLQSRFEKQIDCQRYMLFNHTH